MNTKKTRGLLALIIATVLIFGMTSCSSTKSSSSSQAVSSENAISSVVESQASLDTKTQINIMALNGTTGFGMAKLIDDVNKKQAALNYNVSVETDASNISAALVNGTVDIAALPTNAAAALYNKTKGGVQLLALNTLGVLYLVQNSDKENITSFADLKGKTVYVPAQNPTFVFSYLCAQNGLKVGEDVKIDNTYAQPADLRTALAAGQIDLAVLPEPMVTMAKSANGSLKTAMDLTKEWDKKAPAGSLVQGCIVVRSEFAAAHKNEIKKFLEEYKSSIDYLSTDTKAASTLIESEGIFAKAAVAEKAIPNCNLCFIAGSDMKTRMTDFLNIMFSVAPDSIGGSVPSDDFYYIG